MRIVLVPDSINSIMFVQGCQGVVVVYAQSMGRQLGIMHKTPCSLHTTHTNVSDTVTMDMASCSGIKESYSLGLDSCESHFFAFFPHIKSFEPVRYNVIIRIFHFHVSLMCFSTAV